MKHDSRLSHLVGVVLVGLVGRAAFAADRVVLVEEFTATWCGPCEYAGRAMSQLIDDYPGRLAAYQIHVSDAYATTWGNSRANFYNVTAIPDTWFDGRFEELGASSTQSAYNQYLNILQNRWNIPTPVVLEIGGESLGGDSYRIFVRVSLEATASAGKDLRVQMVQVLDHYPSGARHRDCLMQAAPLRDIHLEPGDTQVLTWDMTLSGASLQNIDDVKVIAFAQKPGTTAPKIVYQAIEMAYPFPPLDTGIAGDVDGDGDVDLNDLAALLAAFGTCDGDVGYLATADFDSSGCVDVSDLAALLANFGQ